MRDLVERRLDAVTDERNGTDSAHLAEYCVILVNAAEELKVGKFPTFSVGDIQNQFPLIRAEIISLATRLSMRTGMTSSPNSITLSRVTKVKVIGQIERLRKMVNEADFSDAQRKKINRKLDELNALTLTARTNFLEFMGTVALIAFGLGSAAADTASFLADAPDAIATISALLGEAKEDEEEAIRQLGALEKPLAIEDKTQRPDLDDEIPF